MTGKEYAKKEYPNLEEGQKQMLAKAFDTGKDYAETDLALIAYMQGAEPREKRIVELEKENEQLRADYDKQKEINKELVDDIADLHKRIRELETQIKQMNEQEARDIRTRFPC